MTLTDYLISPFLDFIFMRRALAACIALSFSCAPIGIILVLRQMSLMGDALSHSILPGVAIGYLIAGLSLPVMGIGGFIVGGFVALIATLISRYTVLREDASFVGLYLIALASGAIIISAVGNNVDLLHILFGQVLGVSFGALILIASISSISLIILAIIYRPLIMECFDPIFMQSTKSNGSLYHVFFMIIVVLNMVSAFQAMGTLMALGLMMLPAISARFWAQSVGNLFAIAIVISILSSYGGLLISYFYELPSGPSIIIVAGVFYVVSLLIGNHGSLRIKVVR